MIKKNFESVQLKLNEICHQLGKTKDDIQLVAVSKFQSLQAIEEAYALGIRDFGENYIQEWQKKSQQLASLKEIRWHLIGNIQKNKAKFLNKNVACLQSLDSVSLAKEIEKKWIEKTPVPVLIQLQVDENDFNKSGVSYEGSKELCHFLLSCKNLSLKGFMGIGPQTDDIKKLEALYRNFVKNCDHIWSLTPMKQEKKIISLGMSSDYEVALRCGSNLIRLGSALFGERAARKEIII